MASSRQDLARPLGAQAWPPIAWSCRPSAALVRRRRGGAASRGEVSIVLHHLQHERREALGGGAGRRKARGGSARRRPDLMVNHLHFPIRFHGGTRRRWPTASPAVVGGICGSGRRPLGRWAVQRGVVADVVREGRSMGKGRGEEERMTEKEARDRVWGAGPRSCGANSVGLRCKA
jgi:hypothetical protein